jgi:ribosomal protein S18 acetylase RimI-like enzyme
MGRTAHVRRAGADDARLLAQLGARLFDQAFAAANDPENMRLYLAGAFSVEQQGAELADGDRATWIAEDAGKAAVGYVTMRKRGAAAATGALAPAEIQRVYVDRAWHGQEVGKALIEACTAQAKAWHCDVIWLAVWEENARAIAFYRKMGFAAVGVQTFMLGRDAQRDIVMAKSVKGV